MLLTKELLDKNQKNQKKLSEIIFYYDQDDKLLLSTMA